MTDAIVLLNDTTKKEIQMNTRTSVFILENVDWGVVESKHQSYKYIDQIGVYVTGTTLETREVSIVGWVASNNYNELRARKSVLNTMINPKEPLIVQVDEYKIKMFPNSSVRYSANYAENNEVVCRFMISGLCADPLFYSQNENKLDGASTLPMFRFPLIIPQPQGIIMGLRQPSLIIAMENEGSVPVGMRIEFYANGTVMNPRLSNAVTQEYFAVNKTMVDGERIIIDTNDGSKRITGLIGTETENYYRYRDLDSTWLKLELGTNLFGYSADSNIDALEVFLYFTNKYLEVQ